MAARIVEALGETGPTPRHGYGELMLELPHVIGTLVGEPEQQGTHEGVFRATGRAFERVSST
jgi:hypothetical protein